MFIRKTEFQRISDKFFSFQKLPVNYGPKNWGCPICSKRFKAPSDTKRHILKHTGEKPFACVLCSRKFAQKAHLDKHMKNKHYIPWRGGSMLSPYSMRALFSFNFVFVVIDVKPYSVWSFCCVRLSVLFSIFTEFLVDFSSCQ